jgi:hypothetical protein
MQGNMNYELTTGDDVRPLTVYDMRQYNEDFQLMQYNHIINYSNNVVWLYENSIRIEVRKLESVELYIFNRTIL